MDMEESLKLWNIKTFILTRKHYAREIVCQEYVKTKTEFETIENPSMKF